MGVYKKSSPTTSASVHQITIDAFFIAIIVLMGFVPQLGYITIVPGLSLTLLHLPVLLGAYLYGWKKGLLYGTAFGITSWLVALQSGVGFNAFFIYPWVSVLPRLLFGLIAGILFTILKKMPKIVRSGFSIGTMAFLLTILHTVLVFIDLWIFYPSEIKALFASTSAIGDGILLTFLGLIALGCLGEAVLAALLVPSLGNAIKKVNVNKEKKQCQTSKN
jgi:uncharacterized membrane protein